MVRTVPLVGVAWRLRDARVTDPTNPTDRVIRTAGQATIGGIVAGVLVAFGVVTEAQGIAVAPLVTLLASLAQNWRGTSA